MVFVLMVKNVWSCRECHNSWLYPRVRKWCNGRAQCPFDFDEYDWDSLFIDLSTSKINTLHQIATSELKDVYDKIHKLEKDHFGVRCFSGNTKDTKNGVCPDIITVPVNFSGYCVDGGKTYYLKFDKKRFPKLANLRGDEDGSKKIWLTEDHLTVANETLLKQPCVDFEMYMLASLVVRHQVPVDDVFRILRSTIGDLTDGRLLGPTPRREKGRLVELMEGIGKTEEMTLAQMKAPTKKHGHQHSSHLSGHHHPRGVQYSQNHEPSLVQALLQMKDPPEKHGHQHSSHLLGHHHP